MISSLPPNIGFAYVMVPLWALDALRNGQAGNCSQIDPGVDPGQGGAGQGAAGPAAGGDCPTSVTDLRLHFLGYEWRAVGQWEVIPHRGLERFVDNDIDDVKDRGDQQARERQAREDSRLEARLDRVPQDQPTVSSDGEDPGGLRGSSEPRG